MGKINSKVLWAKFRFSIIGSLLSSPPTEQGELRQELEKLAKKRIIVGTPRGFMEQPDEFLDDNPYQVHKSGWSIDDFTSRGYKVRGVGFWPIWSYHGFGRNANIITTVIANIISYLISPLIYFFPTLGAGVIAIKDKKKAKNV